MDVWARPTRNIESNETKRGVWEREPQSICFLRTWRKKKYYYFPIFVCRFIQLPNTRNHVEMGEKSEKLKVYLHTLKTNFSHDFSIFLFLFFIPLLRILFACSLCLSRVARIWTIQFDARVPQCMDAGLVGWIVLIPSQKKTVAVQIQAQERKRKARGAATVIAFALNAD